MSIPRNIRPMTEVVPRRLHRIRGAVAELARLASDVDGDLAWCEGRIPTEAAARDLLLHLDSLISECCQKVQNHEC